MECFDIKCTPVAFVSISIVVIEEAGRHILHIDVGPACISASLLKDYRKKETSVGSLADVEEHVNVAASFKCKLDNVLTLMACISMF